METDIYNSGAVQNPRYIAITEVDVEDGNCTGSQEFYAEGSTAEEVRDLLVTNLENAMASMKTKIDELKNFDMDTVDHGLDEEEE